jgi:hypothetical protein
VFFDRSDLPSGEEYDGRIRRAIERSHLFVFLVSPHALRDESYARRNSRSRNGPGPIRPGGCSRSLRRSSSNTFPPMHGRWRTVSHNLHYDLLLVRVAAESLEDADDIGGRFVEVDGERFSEIAIYVAEDSAERRAFVA